MGHESLNVKNSFNGLGINRNGFIKDGISSASQLELSPPPQLELSPPPKKGYKTKWSPKKRIEVPFNNPRQYHESVEKLIKQRQNGIKRKEPIIIFSEEKRPIYGATTIPDTLKDIASFGVYDSHIERQRIGEKCESLIDKEIMKNIQDSALEFIGTKGVSVILPFHKEQTTILGNMNEAIKWVGKDQVFGISSGIDSVSHKEAELSGGNVLEEATIFDAVHLDWRHLRDIAGIDDTNERDTPLKGSKGLGLLAGNVNATVLAERGEIEKDQIIIWHDTDIVNSSEYSAVPLVLWPYTKENRQISEVYASMIARNGAGRNNEVITFVANRLANNKENNEQLARFGFEVGSMVWPLAGERAMRLSRLRDMPMASGMGIETSTNAYIAGVNITERGGHIANVLNPNPKIESTASPPVREFTVLSSCASMLADIGTHIDHTELLPNEWGLEEIKNYNKMFGGRSMDLLLQNDLLARQKPVSVKSNYLIPSINTLIDEDVIKIPN